MIGRANIHTVKWYGCMCPLGSPWYLTAVNNGGD